MVRLKKTAPAAVAVLLLGLLITMPSAFTRFREKSLLNRVVREEISENVLTGNSEYVLSVREKLELIIRGWEGSSGVVLVGGGISDAGSNDNIQEKACRELQKLMDMDAMLNFDLSDCQMLGGEPYNFVDMEDISRSVSAMWLHLEFESMAADVLMDLENSQIYEYNIYSLAYSASGEMDVESVDEMIINFQTYTGLSWEDFEMFYDCSEAPTYVGLKQIL
ncbi:hypothetical protein [Frisingicoccus sp.]|uniref:hypothetical protein n=1 Tax=Frisingicoccus sp. TaxID=1918627 RepID=UPI0015B879E7